MQIFQGGFKWVALPLHFVKVGIDPFTCWYKWRRINLISHHLKCFVKWHPIIKLGIIQLHL